MPKFKPPPAFAFGFFVVVEVLVDDPLPVVEEVEEVVACSEGAMEGALVVAVGE